ncbi:MAG: tRNA pseudouridine55 synthase [Cryomorphaceae bacterium]|jgi:tRNA pseudouridine55 synthase
MTKQFVRIKKNIHGVVLLDKPIGMSSNQALQKLKHRFHARKAGHTGSLDPLATGLLPICFGQATKVSEYLLHSHKKYTTTIKLGEVTDTLDSDGEIVESKPVNVSEHQLQSALTQFRGDIKQIPPMYSALKKDGQPLYKLARKGQVIERPARDMTVLSLDAVRADESHVQLNVHCTSGFYIRSLAHDLGQVLGCGAHVVELRRTDIKSISVHSAYTLEQLESKQLGEILLPIDSLIEDMPRLEISHAQALSLSHGRVTAADQLSPSGLSRLYMPTGELFGIGEVSPSGQLKTHKKFVEN